MRKPASSVEAKADIPIPRLPVSAWMASAYARQMTTTAPRCLDRINCCRPDITAKIADIVRPWVIKSAGRRTSTKRPLWLPVVVFR